MFVDESSGERSGERSSEADRLIESLDDENARIGRAQRRFLSLLREVDVSGAWEDSGARDTAHWLWMRYGVSAWKANRWVRTAHALDGLPRISEALIGGYLGLDKVVELARFAEPATEAKLVGWAQGVSCGAIRRRGDLAARLELDDDVRAERDRFLEWWYFDDERRFGLRAELPAAQGAIVARALERVGGAGAGDARRA